MWKWWFLNGVYLGYLGNCVKKYLAFELWFRDTEIWVYPLKNGGKDLFLPQEFYQINLFQANVPFLYLRKTSENRRFKKWQSSWKKSNKGAQNKLIVGKCKHYC